MTELEAMTVRHSVRNFQDRPIPSDIQQKLLAEISKINRESGLHIQLGTDEPKAFTTGRARYGSFSGVTNYFALIGPKDRSLDVKCGFWGERLVLLSQQLGLNTCWVALTFGKVPSAYSIDRGEALSSLIAVGYGVRPGNGHPVKSYRGVASRATGDEPFWFQQGVKAALLAPSAMNQQKYHFALENGNQVRAWTHRGFYTDLDLGIAMYHFERAAGKENFSWANGS